MKTIFYLIGVFVFINPLAGKKGSQNTKRAKVNTVHIIKVNFALPFKGLYLNGKNDEKLLKERYLLFKKRLETIETDAQKYHFWMRMSKEEKKNKNLKKAKEFLEKAQTIKKTYRYTKYYRKFL